MCNSFQIFAKAIFLKYNNAMIIFNDTPDLRIPLIIFAIVAIVLFLGYILLLAFSFIFMRNFSKDISKKIDFLNLSLYQKCEAINMIISILDAYIKPNNPLYIFSKNENYKEYHRFNVNEIEEFYIYTEKMVTEVQKIYINNDLSSHKKEVENFLKNIEEMNEKFHQTSQLYNTSVVGYNYWRNFFSTKWIKKIFFIKEKQTIK